MFALVNGNNLGFMTDKNPHLRCGFLKSLWTEKGAAPALVLLIIFQCGNHGIADFVHITDNLVGQDGSGIATPIFDKGEIVCYLSSSSSIV